MQIEIRPGLLYFFKGKEDVRVQELVAGLRSAGYRLLVITLPAPEAAKDDLGGPDDCILTLTESVGQNCVDPQNLMVLTDTVTKFIEKEGLAAFLIEDLVLLKQKNEFSRVLRMVGFVYESLALNRGIGIIIIDPRSLDQKEMALLGKEGCMVEDKYRLDIRALQSGTPKMPPSQNL
jgi:hypothetical protein